MQNCLQSWDRECLRSLLKARLDSHLDRTYGPQVIYIFEHSFFLARYETLVLLPLPPLHLPTFPLGATLLSHVILQVHMHPWDLDVGGPSIFKVSSCLYLRHLLLIANVCYEKYCSLRHLLFDYQTKHLSVYVGKLCRNSRECLIPCFFFGD